ncbi:MAG: 2-dehydropantoate 2-reductase [SAR324 cluster bacterium]|nr:2-dehydropantoate 2-reductase [SAR324 cluster bacterium]
MSAQQRTIAVMGAGAVGGYYGARLALAGHRVHFIARGAVLAALRRDGLRVVRDKESFTLPSVSATDNPQEAGEADLVLVTIKGNDLDTATRAIAPMVREGTIVLPLLNGVDISERISSGLGRGIVLDGLTFMPASVPEPGVVRQAGDELPLLLGPRFPEQTGAASETVTLLQGASINAILCEDMQKEIWTKFITFNALAGAESVNRCNLGAMLAGQDSLKLFKNLLQEGEDLALAAGVGIEQGMVERMVKVVSQYPAEHKASMLQDLERGKPLELETTHGAALGIGRKLGVPTPELQRAYDALKPYAAGVPRAASLEQSPPQAD